MIYDSSIDRISGIVILIFDGPEPTPPTIDAYTQRHYGMTGRATIEPPSEFRGLINPGVVTVTPRL